MKLFLVVLLACALGSNAETRETFRGRLNSRGTQTIETMMRTMIRQVNDLIKSNVRLPRMQLGPVSVEGFSVRRLDTSQVSIVMNGNQLGLSLRDGSVHLTAQLAVYIPILFVGNLRVAGQFDTYGDGISSTLASSLGVRSGHLWARGMNCQLRVSRPRVDLHNGLINHFANEILRGVMPGITNGVCEGVKKFGTRMANSIFEVIPTNLNVFNLFRLEFPIVNFRTWSRHMVAGIGMEVRPVSNAKTSSAGLRLLGLPEAEDSNMVCTTVSDFVVNTAARTFLPPGTSFQLDVASVLNMLIKDLFKFAIFVKGTITESPLLLIEAGEIKFTLTTKGSMTDKDGNVIQGTELKPTTISVTCPTNETPMFKSVKVAFSGAFNMAIDVNIADVLDQIIKTINGKAVGQLEKRHVIEKRATNADITAVLNKMFFAKWFNGFRLAMTAKHGSMLLCMSGSPSAAANAKIYGLLRSTFNRG